MTNPLVSVVIPAYNAERTVRAAIDSVLAQTYGELEVIVVDDGSGDDTCAVVEAVGDARVRLVAQPNGGAAAARNTGIGQATGRWVALLDADDVWLPDKVERQLVYLRQHPDVGAVQGSVLFVDDDFEVVGVGRCRPSKDPLLDALRFRNYPALPSTVLVEREALLGIGMFDPGLVILEDWDFAIKLARYVGLGTIVEPLSLYRVHAGNRSRDIDIHLAPGLAVLERLFTDENLPPEIAQREPEIRAGLFAMLAGGHFKEGSRVAAARWAWQAVRTSPRVLPYVLGMPLRRLTRRLASLPAIPTRRCPACDALGDDDLGVNYRYDWRTCRTCGTSFVDRLPTDDELVD